MNAQELTEVVDTQRIKINRLIKDVEYLTQEVEKLRMLVNDHDIDIKMLERRRS